ncbi:hypothetical protein [Mycobacterium sp. SMC-2]|uniref:hypothetical protein n=1 Tax=Mycobacterium sp. SMC-2 TaxID=2857058 RepID=UPI0021B452C5|nr:hypothetical protein [Mycobacterium sp. SMC-2]
MQQHRFATMATHHAFMGMSDQPGQHRQQDPFAALINQCYQARTGQDDGFNAMEVPF